MKIWGAKGLSKAHRGVFYEGQVGLPFVANAATAPFPPPKSPLPCPLPLMDVVDLVADLIFLFQTTRKEFRLQTSGQVERMGRTSWHALL